MKKIVRMLLWVVAIVPQAALAVPEVIHHQGRVSVDGVNFDGTGQFKFMLYSRPNATPPGTDETAIWKNDDASPATMAAPAGKVPLAVSKGLYSVGLGGAGTAQLPPSLDTAIDQSAYLRVWFDDGVNGFQQLAPDQPLRAVPYALHAKTASAVLATGDIQFATPRAGKLQVSPAAFQPDHVTPAGYKAIGDYFFPASGAPVINGLSVYRISAPVQLPHGAVVTKVEFFVFDEEGGPTLVNFTGTLAYRSMSPPDSSGTLVMATAQSFSPAAAVLATTAITSATVSRDNVYLLDVRFSTNGSTQNIGFLGATIHYTIASLQP